MYKRQALVNDHPVTKIDCSVEKGKVILTNPSDYVINGFLNDKAITHVIVFPQQQLRMELQDVAGACPFDGTEESSLLIDKPEISYRYETRITKDNVRTSKLLSLIHIWMMASKIGMPQITYNSTPALI